MRKRKRKLLRKRAVVLLATVAITASSIAPLTRPVARETLPEYILKLKNQKKGLHSLQEEEYWFEIEVGSRLVRHTIPRGFVTDFNSVPWIAMLFVERDNIHNMAAALIHDYLYETGLYSREMCDMIYYSMLIKAGTEPKIAARAYKALKMFGGKAYNKYRKAEGSKL